MDFYKQTKCKSKYSLMGIFRNPNIEIYFEDYERTEYRAFLFYHSALWSRKIILPN